MTTFPACFSSLIVSTGASNRSISYIITSFVLSIVPIERRHTVIIISKIEPECNSTL